MSIAYPISNTSFYLVESPNSNIFTNDYIDIIDNLKLKDKLYQTENFTFFINESNKLQTENILIDNISTNLIFLPGNL